MADAVTSQTLTDNDRRAVIKLTNVSDGTGESAVTKVDVSALNTDREGRTCTGVAIERIHYDVNGMKVRVLWDATTDADCIILTDASAGTLCFKDFGGLTNNAGAGVTGDIKFTTIAASANDSYSVVLCLLKNYD